MERALTPKCLRWGKGLQGRPRDSASPLVQGGHGAAGRGGPCSARHGREKTSQHLLLTQLEDQVKGSQGVRGCGPGPGLQPGTSIPEQIGERLG